MFIHVTDGNEVLRVLAIGCEDAIEHASCSYAFPHTTRKKGLSALWVSAVQKNVLEPVVRREWLNWNILGR